MTTSQTLANSINSFDYYYEMSDSDRTYSNGERAQKAIKDAASERTSEENDGSHKIDHCRTGID